MENIVFMTLAHTFIHIQGLSLYNFVIMFSFITLKDIKKQKKNEWQHIKKMFIKKLNKLRAKQ